MPERPDRPGILAPPPLLTLLSLGAGLVADHYNRVPIFEDLALLRIVLSVALLVVAGGVFIASLKELHAHGTTPNPYQPTSAVVSSGIYRFSRNPIYVGFVAIAVATALALNSLGLLVSATILVVLLHFGVIKREERYLSAKFGAEYDVYRGRVRRWL